MTDELYPHYDRELAFLRSMAADFAGRYPGVAARLDLGARESRDPHVERLLQGVAFLNARIQHRLDDDLPEIAEALLGVLYPHYIQPTPSLCILQFAMAEGAGELTEGCLLPRGTLLDSEPEPRTRSVCRFQTCYPVQIWPCAVETCEFLHRPFASPPGTPTSSALSALRLRLRTTSRGVNFAKLKIPRLRFYLHAGETPDVYRLYELLFTRVVRVVVGSPNYDQQPHRLSKDCLQPVGFRREESLRGGDARTFVGYRMLADFFALPQKFLFFELDGLPVPLRVAGDRLEILILFDCENDVLQRSVSPNTLRLGCTPAINLYSQRLVPQILDQTRTEYRVDPSGRARAGEEVVGIEEVTSSASDGRVTAYQPLFCFRHGESQKPRAFWRASRRARPSETAEGTPDRAEDVYLSFVDLDFSPDAPADAVLHVQATVCNGDLPSQLVAAAGRPKMKLCEGGAVLKEVACLVHPTPALRPAKGYGTLWRLVSHLALNHLSISGGADGAAALRELLTLYDQGQSAENRSAIQGVIEVDNRTVIRRIGQQNQGFGQGVQIRLLLNEKLYVGGSAYLFSSVLDRFFGLYAGINAFSELVVQCQQRPEQEAWTWPIRSGEQRLV